MGAPHKENTTESNASVSDSNMEVKKDEDCNHEENLTENEDPVVNSSDTSLLQDDSIVNSDLSSSMSDSSLLNETKLCTDAVNEDAVELESKEFALKSDDEKSSILSDSSEYTKRCESILNKNSGKSEAAAISPHENSEVIVHTDESMNGKNISARDVHGVDFDLSQDEVLNVNTNDSTANNLEENSKIEINTTKIESVNKDSEAVVDRDEKVQSSVESIHKSGFEEPRETDHHSNTNSDNEVLLSPTKTSQKSASDLVNEEILVEKEIDNADIISDDFQNEKINDSSEEAEKSLHLSDNETCEKSTLQCDLREAIVETDSNVVSNEPHGAVCGILEKDSLQNESPASKEDLSSPGKVSDDESTKLISNKKPRKCPKIKISFMKNTEAGSTESLKNWFVSERKNSDEQSNPDLDVQALESSDSSINLNISSDLNAKMDANTSSDAKESDINAIPYNDNQLSTVKKTPVETNKENSCNYEIYYMDASSDKLNSSSSVENSAALNIQTPPTLSGSAPDNERNISSEKLSAKIDDTSVISENNISSVSIEGFDSSIKIKEEPMDYDEKVETGNSDINSTEHLVKTAPMQVTRRRGRPRKSADLNIPSAKNKSVEIDTAANVLVKEIKIKEEKIETPVPVTPSSAGRKKNSPKSTSTPNASGGRRKNYDPQLVIAPFAQGWMREHVLRATSTEDRKFSDIYYFSPDGKKLRSMPEISSYLSKNPDMKLTLANFTFAKELVFREPFEIERDAKQAKIDPAKKIKVPSSPKKKLISPATSIQSNSKALSETISPSLNSNKKVARHRLSSFKQTGVSLNDSRSPKRSKQTTLNSYLPKQNDESETKSLRPTRKIIKRVPFDNSFENMFPKTPRATAKRNSTGGIKIKIKTEPIDIDYSVTNSKEQNVLKVRKEKELSSNHSPSDVNSSLSSTVHDSEPSVAKHNSASSSLNKTNELHLERTNIKSPEVKNKLRVKFATTRKSEP